MESYENMHRSMFDTIVLSLKQQNIDYFIQLVRVAMIDGTICEKEFKLLQQVGKRIKLSDEEISYYIETTISNEYKPPYEQIKIFEQLHYFVKMILADGIIEKNELRLAHLFAAKLGFSNKEISGLLQYLIEGIKAEKNEKELYELYYNSVRKEKLINKKTK